VIEFLAEQNFNEDIWTASHAATHICD